MKKDSISEASTALNSKQSSRTDLDDRERPAKNTRSHSSSDDHPMDPLDIVKELENALHDIEEEESSVVPMAAEPKSTIKLVPLRRNDGKQSKGVDDEDLLFNTSKPAENSPNFRPSTTTATTTAPSGGGRRGMGGLMKPLNSGNNDKTDDCGSPNALLGVASPTTNNKSLAERVAKQDNVAARSGSPRMDGDGKDKDSLYLAMQSNHSSSSASMNNNKSSASLSSNYSHSELRRMSHPGSSTDSVSPVPRSHPNSAAGSHRKDLPNAHNRVIPAGLASIQSHNTSVLKFSSGHGSSQVLESSSNVPSPSSSPLVTSLKKSHHYSNNNSPQTQANHGVRSRFT
jgi:hypothetical protein